MPAQPRSRGGLAEWERERSAGQGMVKSEGCWGWKNRGTGERGWGRSQKGQGKEVGGEVKRVRVGTGK